MLLWVCVMHIIEECRKIRGLEFRGRRRTTDFPFVKINMQHKLLSLPFSIIEFPVIGKIFHVLIVIVSA